MSEEKNTIINFNGREYTAEDLNEEQMGLAVELNVVGKQLARLQEAAQTFNSLNNYKNILIEKFDTTLPKEEVIEEE
jgi:hypothetical protein